MYYSVSYVNADCRGEGWTPDITGGHCLAAIDEGGREILHGIRVASSIHYGLMMLLACILIGFVSSLQAPFHSDTFPVMDRIFCPDSVSTH